jgi:hypothetical protein
MGWATLWATFFTNSSGHPVRQFKPSMNTFLGKEAEQCKQAFSDDLAKINRGQSYFAFIPRKDGRWVFADSKARKNEL